MDGWRVGGAETNTHDTAPHCATPRPPLANRFACTSSEQVKWVGETDDSTRRLWHFALRDRAAEGGEVRSIHHGIHPLPATIRSQPPTGPPTAGHQPINQPTAWHHVTGALA